MFTGAASFLCLLRQWHGLVVAIMSCLVTREKREPPQCISRQGYVSAAAARSFQAVVLPYRTGTDRQVTCLSHGGSAACLLFVATKHRKQCIIQASGHWLRPLVSLFWCMARSSTCCRAQVVLVSSNAYMHTPFLFHTSCCQYCMLSPQAALCGILIFCPAFDL